MRVSWKTELRDAAAPTSSTAARSAGRRGRSRRCTSACCAAACSSRCTCTPATATCTPTSRSTPTTTRCCRRRTRRSRASCGSRASLGGVISGEHGIGITKLEFLEPERARGLPRLQAARRSGRPLQRGQAAGRRATCANAYTPSFSLIGAETLILEQTEIGAIADMIKDCLRCGKCKPVCATHVPRANLLYSPRNKILATSLLTEAFLYEEQTRRGVSLEHFDEFGDVADHCTVCHKCVKPVPGRHRFRRRVDRDAQLLRRAGQAPLQPRHAARRCCSSTRPIRARSSCARTVMIEWGYRAQRLAHRVAQGARASRRSRRAQPPATDRQAAAARRR